MLIGNTDPLEIWGSDDDWHTIAQRAWSQWTEPDPDPDSHDDEDDPVVTYDDWAAAVTDVLGQERQENYNTFTRRLAAANLLKEDDEPPWTNRIYDQTGVTTISCPICGQDDRWVLEGADEELTKWAVVYEALVGPGRKQIKRFDTEAEARKWAHDELDPEEEWEVGDWYYEIIEPHPNPQFVCEHEPEVDMPIRMVSNTPLWRVGKIEEVRR